MQVYVGHTGATKMGRMCVAAGFGECLQPDEGRPYRSPYFLDNGAYKDYKAGREFNEEKFIAAVSAAAERDELPSFVVAPDVVAGGLSSLAFSRSWVGRLREMISCPIYLVTQDGMTLDAVREALPEFDGLFVGGTDDHKRDTGKQWVDLAHEHGKKCHVGRAGTLKKVRWARRIGADSIDSAFPLWTYERMRKFIWETEDRQGEWWR